MGYGTRFEGVLYFPKGFLVDDLHLITRFLGEDVRDHPEWHRFVFNGKDLTYIDLMLTSDSKGLQWDGAEKSYDMVDKVNLILHFVRDAGIDDFTFTGSLLAQGEDINDRWRLEIQPGCGGWAYKARVEAEPEGTICPTCGYFGWLEG